MEKTIKYCDICGKEEKYTAGVDVKWCGEKEYTRFDICKSCKEDLKGDSSFLEEKRTLFINLVKRVFKK